MTSRIQPAWLLPGGLMALSLVPSAAGIVRLVRIGGGATAADNARFLADPWPAALHIVAALLFGMLGAWQFAGRWRQAHPVWHRRAGRLLVPCGLVTALSGLWMTLFYPTANFDGVSVYLMRLLVGAGMTAALVLGFVSARQRRFAQHQAWMMRAYALALGAGTQVFTHLPWLFLPDWQGETTRALSMGAGWVINLALVEWLLWRRNASHNQRSLNAGVRR